MKSRRHLTNGANNPNSQDDALKVINQRRVIAR